MRPQLVIPMSGFGERFRARGFNVPKPLIPVAGRPIIEHVLEMYPDELDVLFIVKASFARFKNTIFIVIYSLFIDQVQE